MSYQILFKNAVKLYEEGGFDAAEAIVREILISMPDEPAAKKLLGFIAFEKELYEQAAEIFFEILIADSQDVEVILKLAQTLEAWGKYSEAIDYYDKTLALNKDNVMALFGTGVCFQALGQIEKAKSYYEKTLGIDKENWQALLGMASIVKDDKEKSIGFLKKAMDASSDNPFVLYELASFHKDGEKYNEAISYIENAVSIYSHPRMQDLQSQLYYLTGKKDEAEKILSLIIKETPNYIPAYISLAEILADKGDFKNAKKNLTTALEYNRDYADVYVNLGAIAHKQGLLLEAIENYRKAMEINPYIPEVLLNLAFILHEQGDLDEALGMYFNVLSINPNIVNLDKGLYEAISDYMQFDKENAKKLALLWQKTSSSSELANEAVKKMS